MNKRIILSLTLSALLVGGSMISSVANAQTDPSATSQDAGTTTHAKKHKKSKAHKSSHKKSKHKKSSTTEAPKS